MTGQGAAPQIPSYARLDKCALHSECGALLKAYPVGACPRRTRNCPGRRNQNKFSALAGWRSGQKQKACLPSRTLHSLACQKLFPERVTARLSLILVAIAATAPACAQSRQQTFADT